MKFLIVGIAMAMLAGDVEAGAIVVREDSELGRMDAETARRFFMGREGKLDGAAVVVVYQKSGALREQFERQILDKTGPDLAAYWSKLIFTGRAKAPLEIDGDAAVQAKVASTVGAIGYVSGKAVVPGLKIVHEF